MKFVKDDVVKCASGKRLITKLKEMGFKEVQEEVEEKPLNKMRTAELEAKAKELGVDLSDCKNNDERVAKLEEALKEVE